MRFVARGEEELAPKTVAAFKASLPLDDRIIHCRWSGSPTGSRGATATSGSARRTRPRTRTRASSRSIRAGERDRAALSVRLLLVRVEGRPSVGDHFATLVEGGEQLPELGRLTLWEGAQQITFREL